MLSQKMGRFFIQLVKALFLSAVVGVIAYCTQYGITADPQLAMEFAIPFGIVSLVGMSIPTLRVSEGKKLDNDREYWHWRDAFWIAVLIVSALEWAVYVISVSATDKPITFHGPQASLALLYSGSVVGLGLLWAVYKNMFFQEDEAARVALEEKRARRKNRKKPPVKKMAAAKKAVAKKAVPKKSQ